MCGCKKKENLTLSVCLQSYLVIWNMIAILGSVWLQKTKVCHCKKLLVYFCDCKKENLTLTVCLQSDLVIWNMIASLGSLWLQKTKVCHCKNCWFISMTAKKKKKN
jgi:hypothetical protein